jgi:hypothetical protein
MMQEEFERRIGLHITYEEYEPIEAAYAGLPETVDKDKFARIWLKEGGIQDLFNKRQLRVNILLEREQNLEKKISELNSWVDELLADRGKYAGEVVALRKKLAAIVAMAAEDGAAHEARSEDAA